MEITLNIQPWLSSTLKVAIETAKSDFIKKDLSELLKQIQEKSEA